MIIYTGIVKRREWEGVGEKEGKEERMRGETKVKIMY